MKKIYIIFLNGFSSITELIENYLIIAFKTLQHLYFFFVFIQLHLVLNSMTGKMHILLVSTKIHKPTKTV